MDRFNNKNHVGFFDMLDLGQENGEIPEDCLELDL